jgi:hypothetical protein
MKCEVLASNKNGRGELNRALRGRQKKSFQIADLEGSFGCGGKI